MKKNNKITYHTEEQKEMIHFLIVFAVVLVVVCAVYFFSKVFVLDQNLFDVSYEAGVVNSERVVVGTLFNRPEKEYYVIAYDETGSQAVYYSSLTTNYKNKQTGALKIYHLNLDNELNKDYYVKEGSGNSQATKSSEVRLKNLTLIKIKNGKIDKYLEKLEDIEKELAVTTK